MSIKNEITWNNLFKDENILKFPNGEVIEGTCIWPNFVQEQLDMNIQRIWDVCLQYPEQDPKKQIEYSKLGMDPLWITGEHKALNYRGNAVGRTKMWFKTNYLKGLSKYGYTGWQWKISYAKRDINSISILRQITNKINEKLKWKHNDWIVTRYNHEKDNIGFHSDKWKNFQENSQFVVIKCGAPRLFQFSLPTGEIIYSKKLNPGTAIFVGEKANQLVKHAVPKMKEKCGVSGSIVGRCIKTIVPWTKVHKEVNKRVKDINLNLSNSIK